MLKIVLPQTRVVNFSAPAVFLRGPTKDVLQWVGPALDFYRNERENDDLYVLIPTRDIGSHFNAYIVPESECQTCYDSVVEWERAHLRRIGREGTLAFWFPRQVGRPNEGEAPGLVTALELGYVLGEASSTSRTGLCVGIDPSFRYRKEVQAYLSGRVDVVNTSIEDVCKAAEFLATRVYESRER